MIWNAVSAHNMTNKVIISKKMNLTVYTSFSEEQSVAYVSF